MGKRGGRGHWPWLEPWLHRLPLCDRGKVLAFSEPVLPHLAVGVIIGPPLEKKGGFHDVTVKWLAQGTSDKHAPVPGV